MPLLLAAGYALGWALAHAWRLLWWLLRVAWTLSWRLAVIGAALCVVAFSRSLAWRLAAGALGAALTGRVARKGGRGDGGSPATSNAPGGMGKLATASKRLTVRPVSAQRVVTADHGVQRFHVRGVAGPELLTMTCGFAGCGKTEVLMGRWRAQYDGRDFCGLPTVRQRGARKLLLTEMSPRTLGPVLERWGFAERPRGWLHDKRLRYLPVRGGPGGYIDVLYAEQVLAPLVVDGETVTPDWPNVVERVAPLAEKGDYDELAVDSLAEWMGDDSQGNMLRTLALCRQITRRGPGVDVLHHTPRSDPRRPRGSGAIDGKLDVGWSVYGLSPAYAPRSLHDPVRVFAPFKSRFPDDAPREPLHIERLWAGPQSGTVPVYRLAGDGAESRHERPSLTDTAPDPAPDATTVRRREVLDALLAAGPSGTTIPEVATQTGHPRQRVADDVVALIRESLVRTAGKRATPGGGPAAGLYVAVGAQRPRLRLVDAHAGAAAESPEAGAEGGAEAPAAIAGAPGETA